MTTNNDVQETDAAGANGATRGENTKPVTILVPEDTLRKLKIVAIMKETTVGELLAEAAIAVVRRDLRKVLAKLEVP
jgi:hypothetical protein